ncbi:LysM peptidoglycan-binding domain-containing protein [Fructilactobacillus hinvesii]|uniref:LysM peptidoglycan-binding domain-containing protein n=1 Tax=Fructilactobacillus hinvesii TaxID=2940300 RepID=A0ABY5BUG1_9LACO|nr:LysM peptidoglycan-binding domain-containing protein [Fructilactobacillus hinvesii]USS88083.1 LysM peptidoglycan-binding domain-containing protein [Fructilactobacillus hinvesii]
MKLKGIKTVAAITAVSAGVLFAGANSANASTKITVKSGDTLSQLAQTYGVSVDSLQKANHIQDINKIYVGEVFVVGDDGNVQVTTANSQAAQTATPAQPHYEVKQAAAQAETPAQPATQAQQTSQATQTETPAQPAAQAQPQATAQAETPSQPAAQAQPQQTSQAASTQAATTSNDNASADNDGSLDSIAAVESGGSYTARNGQYIGKYQLSASYLNGDYSPANQERVARQYAISRYGSVANAVAFRNSHNYW